MQIDIVNENNIPVGVIDRSNVLGSGKNFRTVHAWLRNSNNELLLQRLVKDHPRSPHMLGSSVAGYLHAGETYDEAIVRKSVLEVGRKPFDLKKVGVVLMSDEGSTKFVSLYIGRFEDDPRTQDPHIEGFETIGLEALDQRFSRSPESFTATFGAIFSELRSEIDW